MARKGPSTYEPVPDEPALGLVAALLIAVCGRALVNRKYEPGQAGNRRRLDATRSS